jgi:hypothetical protein
VAVEVINHIDEKEVEEPNFKKTDPKPIWPKHFNSKSCFSPEPRINLTKLIVIEEAESNSKARIINYKDISPRNIGEK